MLGLVTSLVKGMGVLFNKVYKMGKRLVCGWGINDADYDVCKYEMISGKRKQVWVCQYYQDWKSILSRCHYINFQENNPTYKDCTVCEEWKYLSNFIKWVDSQPNRDWRNCNPDKDFLIKGNKHYSPDTVVYIRPNINTFITDNDRSRGDLMIGVSFSLDKNKNPYRANCRNPFASKQEHLGYFPDELLAHLAWKAKKHEHACRFAEMQDDSRVAEALRTRYI